MRATGRLGGVAALLCAVACAPVPTLAQMVLPGAVAPTPEGATQAAPAPRRSKPASAPGEERINRGAAVTVPTVTSLLGKPLLLNGSSSALVFGSAPGKALTVTRLELAGEKISAGRETCKVAPDPAPIAVTDLGRAGGIARYRIDNPACPITFDVLDGAVLVPPEPATCEVVQADCRVRIAGLWGPPPSELGPERIKGLERARGGAESAVRSNYRALATSTKDKPTVMGFAKDQAQFSSSREETCRDYADEGRHNFCATKLTEARAATLHALLEVALAAKATRKTKRGPTAR